MSALVDLIKRIGIFMIAAQAVIHFAPAQKYEKYMKLIVGILILVQFLMPVYHIFTGTEWDWEKISIDMESVFGIQETGEKLPEEIDGTASLADTVLKKMEEEIKSRLNSEISEKNYSVSGVRVTMKTSGGRDENGILQYEIERVRVVVRQTHSVNDVIEQNETDKIEKIQVEKIDIGAGTAAESEKEEEDAADGREKKEKELKNIFCRVLGMDEEKLEVIVYGMDEENSG